MIDTLLDTLLYGGSEPHDIHFEGHPALMWANIAANALIALAYFSIPAALWYVARKRKDIEHRRMFFYFAVFILGCGFTHLLHVATFWRPLYGLETIVDGITAIASVGVAFILWKIIPVALKLPSPAELAAAELEVRKKEQELALQRDLEERKNEFIAAASHELKTPLTSQKVFIETLRQTLERDGRPEYGKRFDTILSQIRRQERLVADLLDIARIEGKKVSFDVSDFSLEEVVRNAAEEAAAAAKGKSVDVRGAISRTTRGDRERVAQVVSNLLSNALKFSPGSDTVVAHLSETDAEAIVRIQDFGIGIDPEHHGRIFERFYRVNGRDERTFPGMGIGLFISAEIVRMHGGRIGVESERDKGSTFWFALPHAGPGGPAPA